MTDYKTIRQGAIEWYQHYMAVPAAELAVAYALRKHADQDVTAAMEMAMEEREQEIADKMVDGEL